MIVHHVVLVPIVIRLYPRVPVVRGVDVDLALEDMGRGVGRVDVCDQGGSHWVGGQVAVGLGRAGWDGWKETKRVSGKAVN